MNSNDKIKKLIEKILNCKKINEKCIFSDDEKNFIKNDISISFYIDTETRKNSIKLFHLLCNVNNDFDDDFINYAKNILSIPYMFLSDQDIQEIALFGIKIKDISNTSMKINDKTLSLEQNRIYELFDKFNVCLKAGTGTGKTFITTNFLIKRYKEQYKFNEKFIFIVPTEILESQIINNLKNNYPDIQDKIGNSIIENDIFIGTWEKLIFAINPKEVLIKIDTLIIDEAHYLFLKDDERSDFFRHILSLYFKNQKEEINKVIMVSPFELNIDMTDKIFGNINFVYIDYNKRNRINKWNFNENEEVNENFNNEEDYEKMIRNNVDSVSCILVSSKEKAKERAKQLFEDEELCNKIAIQQKNDVKKISDIKNDLSSNKWNNFEKYLNFKYIKKGICYLTADIPDIIKNKIIDLVNERYIRFVVATSLIISGVDLPFDITYMDTHKINNINLNSNDVINYFGRAGRISIYKKAYAAGFSYIKRNISSNKWWNENRNNILEKLNSGESEVLNVTNLIDSDKSRYFNKSYEKYNETQDVRYIYDPRINPDTVDFIVKKIKFNVDDYRLLVSSLCKKWINNKEDSKLLSTKDMITIIFLLYKINNYKYSCVFSKGIIDEFSEFLEREKLNNFKDICNNFFKFKEQNYDGKSLFNRNETMRNLMFNLDFYSSYGYNAERSIRPYVVMKYKNNNEENLTKDIEHFVDHIKRIGKFHLMNFINHLYLLSCADNENIYTSFSIINSIFVTNNQFYRFLWKNNFINKYVSKIINNKYALKYWKKINRLDNTLSSIYQEIDNLGKNTKLYSILKEDNEFCKELKKYIEEINGFQQSN